MTFTLAQLAELTDSTCFGDPKYLILAVADLESATAEDVSFLANPRYLPLLKKTQAGVVCIGKNDPREEGKNYLVSENPSRTFQQIAETFLKNRKPTAFTGIHPTAVIHETAQIGQGVNIGPYVVIDQDAVIGDHTTLSSHVYVGPGSLVGNHCILYPHSVVREYCQLKDRVILQPGAVIGSCGFGYTTNEMGEHTKLKQIGNVIVEDDVEVGANTTIDRARFKTTRIGKGTKIDNLVQIAHNVELGAHNLLASQTGIAGTTKTGRNVMMGGQVGIVGHLEITDFVMIATRGGVSKSIKTKGKYAGSPVIPLADYNRNKVQLRQIEAYVKRIEALEEALQALSH